MPSDAQIEAAASFLAKAVCRHDWDHLYEGSAVERGFDPWWNGGVSKNARRGDYREAVRQLFKLMTDPH